MCGRVFVEGPGVGAVQSLGDPQMRYLSAVGGGPRHTTHPKSSSQWVQMSPELEVGRVRGPGTVRWVRLEPTLVTRFYEKGQNLVMGRVVAVSQTALATQTTQSPHPHGREQGHHCNPTPLHCLFNRPRNQIEHLDSLLSPQHPPFTNPARGFP